MIHNNSYSITVDSELLQHFAPDILHPSSQKIQAVYDENQNPLVFSTTDEALPRLALTIADPVTGKNKVYDLSKALGITLPIENLVAIQDDSQNIYLAFTVTYRPTESNLYVVKATKPETWRDLSKVANLLIHPTSNYKKNFTSVAFVPSANAGTFFHDSNYPLLVAGVGPVISRIKVDAKTNMWTLVTGELISNIHEGSIILDTVVLSPQSFILATTTLYATGTSPVLKTISCSYYNTTTRSFLYSRYFQVPSDIKKLAVITNQSPDKTNDLILVGTGLWHLTAYEIYGKKSISSPKRLSPVDDPTDRYFFNDIQDVITSQSGTEVSVWLRTMPAQIGESTLCSTMISTRPDGSAVVSQPTIPIYSGEISDISPIFHTASQSHHFLLLDKDGQHVLLQFKPGNSVWEETSFLIENPAPDPDVPKMTSTVSYQSHIIVRDARGYPLSSSQVMITASDTVNVFINGQSTTISPQAVTVLTDGRGCLSIVSPVDSLGSSSVLRLQIGTTPVGQPIDPAANIRKRLSGINSGQALRDARVQSDGSPLLGTSIISDPAVDQAGAALGKLHAQLESLSVDGAPNSITTLGLFSKAWAAWHYIEHKAQAVVNEFKEVEGKVVAMVIKIGDEAVEFAIDTAARALKAINYVLKQIKVELERIVDWIGFIFAWKDIKKTQSDFVGVTKAYFKQLSAWAPIIVPILNKSLESGVDMIDTMLDEMTSGNLKVNGTLGSFYESVQQGSRNQTSTPEKLCPSSSHAGITSANSSPGGQWTNNQMMSGGIVPLPTDRTQLTFLLREEPRRFHPPTDKDIVSVISESGLAQFEAQFRKRARNTACIDSETFNNSFRKIEDLGLLLEPILADAEHLFKDLTDNLETVIRSNLEDIGANLVKVVTTFAKDVLKTLKDTIEAFLNAAEDIIATLVSYVLEESLNIPFISALWHHFTGQDPPNILEIFSILLAIPTTVIAKIAAPKGDAFWPDLTAWSNGSAYASFPVNNMDPTASFNQIKAAMTGTLVEPLDDTVQNSTKAVFGPGDKAWENWAKATICAHPVATLVEGIAQFVNYALFAKIKPVPKSVVTGIETVERICLVAEFVAVVFSFPNLDGFDGESGKLKASMDCEITSFGIRAIDILLTTLFTSLSSRADEAEKDRWNKCKDAVAVLCTAFEFGLNLAATVLRLQGLKAESPEDKVETTANDIAMGNVFSSLGAQYAIFASGKTENPYLAAAAGALTVADFGLDLGRGIYEWVEQKKDKVVEDGALAGSYSSTHRVVTY